MSVASMTGFARMEGHAGVYTWAWEAKSVNGRGLDVRCRVPAGMDWLEQVARDAASERFKRGHIVAHLQVSLGEGASAVRINRDVLDQLSALAKELEAEVGAAPPRADGLLALRGVIEVVEVEESAATKEEREGALTVSLLAALDELAERRRDEGARLADIVSAHLDNIASLTKAGEANAAAQPRAIRARLEEAIAAVLEAAPSLSEERLEQEVAVLINKADVREELDRLGAHLAAARDLLEAGGAVGRRLDFIAQELNREANTLCAKSVDVELTRVGLDIKALIDQFREQVQNIE